MTKTPLFSVLMVLILLLGACTPATVETPSVVPPVVTNDGLTLVIAFTPDMMPFATEMANRFNATRGAGQGKVRVEKMESDAMVAAVSQPTPAVHAISPDSSIWLNTLGDRVSSMYRYALSPIVIAMWQDKMGGSTSKEISWQDLKTRATQQGLKWNHPSMSQASGLLTTLAEFYASAEYVRQQQGDQQQGFRGLTPDVALSDAVVTEVAAIEKSVRYYGESELSIYERLKTDGTDSLDAFVSQESLVIAWNKEQARKLVALHPKEGGMWADHPLVKVEFNENDAFVLSDEQTNTYYDFAKFLRSKESQEYALALGYRPADATISLKGTPNSPFATTDFVDASYPQTVLQIPSDEVMQIVRDAWAITKKPTNVVLVIDTSGSMGQDNKMAAMKDAVKSFITNFSGNKDRLAIVEFGSNIKIDTGLISMSKSNKEEYEKQQKYFLGLVNKMQPDKGTALIDATYRAAEILQAAGDPDAINAVVVMTDGVENESERDLDSLVTKLTDQTSIKIVAFSVAFGEGATVSNSGQDVMGTIAKETDGQFYRASTIDITKLYEIIAKYLF